MKPIRIFQSLILTLLIGAAFGVSAQSPTTLKQRCPNTSVYSIIQITATGAETFAPCATKSVTITDIPQTAQFNVVVTPSNTVGIFRAGDCVTTPTACLSITQSTNTIALGNSTQTGATALDVAGINDWNLQRTVTAGGTTGAQTINKPAGTVNIAAGQASIVITNNTVTTSSLPFVTVRTGDATCTFVKAAVSTANTLTITLNAACTAETSIGFVVYN